MILSDFVYRYVAAAIGYSYGTMRPKYLLVGCNSHYLFKRLGRQNWRFLV